MIIHRKYVESNIIETISGEKIGEDIKFREMETSNVYKGPPPSIS